MPDEEQVAQLLARIEPPGDGTAQVSRPDDVTGELARLLQWWHAVGSTAAPVVSRPVPTQDSTSLTDGIAAADRAIDAGASLLVAPPSTPDDVAARALIALLTRREPQSVVHQPPGTSDADWMALVSRVRDTSAARADLRGDPLELARSLDDGVIVWTTGMLLAAAARRTPCLVDGTSAWAAALVADRLSHRAHGWWRPGSTSPDPARGAAMDRIGLHDALPLGLSDDSGRGSSATIELLRSVAETID